MDRVYDAGIEAKACARKFSTSTSIGVLSGRYIYWQLSIFGTVAIQGCHCHEFAVDSVMVPPVTAATVTCSNSPMSTDYFVVTSGSYTASWSVGQWPHAIANCNLPITTHTHTQPFNGLFSRTTWVGRNHKDKPFWIVLKQEMTGRQWHQLNHMQIICTSLKTDNHASTSSLHIFYRPDALPAPQPTASKH